MSTMSSAAVGSAASASSIRSSSSRRRPSFAAGSPDRSERSLERAATDAGPTRRPSYSTSTEAKASSWMIRSQESTASPGRSVRANQSPSASCSRARAAVPGECRPRQGGLARLALGGRGRRECDRGHRHANAVPGPRPPPPSPSARRRAADPFARSARRAPSGRATGDRVGRGTDPRLEGQDGILDRHRGDQRSAARGIDGVGDHRGWWDPASRQPPRGPRRSVDQVQAIDDRDDTAFDHLDPAPDAGWPEARRAGRARRGVRADSRPVRRDRSDRGHDVVRTDGQEQVPFGPTSSARGTRRRARRGTAPIGRRSSRAPVSESRSIRRFDRPQHRDPRRDRRPPELPRVGALPQLERDLVLTQPPDLARPSVEPGDRPAAEANTTSSPIGTSSESGRPGLDRCLPLEAIVRSQRIGPRPDRPKDHVVVSSRVVDSRSGRRRSSPTTTGVPTGSASPTCIPASSSSTRTFQRSTPVCGSNRITSPPLERPVGK